MKRIKRVISMLLMAVTACLCVSCGPDGGVVNDGKTVNVMMVNSGYGRDWIDDIAAAFNRLYASEGYKVNILEPKASFASNVALGEMRLGTATGYDIVIPPGVTVQQATDENEGRCVESLDDMYELGAINFDGTVSDTPLKERLIPSEDYYLKNDGTYYCFPYNKSMRGLVCNTKFLAKYGITELPITTDELFEDYNIILNGIPANNAEGLPAQKGLAPTVWGGNNGYGYANPVLYIGLAQMFGVDKYDEYMKMDYLLDNDGNVAADGYKMSEETAIKDVLQVIIQAFDVMYSMNGSVNQKHDAANASVISGRTAFMFNGNYFFNEVEKNFGGYLADVDFVPNPIISELGVQLQLDGSGTDRAKCDEILSFMAKKVDDGKTAAEVKSLTEAAFSGITISDEQANWVYEARRIGYDHYGGAYIIKDSPVKDIAKLFLRMLASEDAAKIYYGYGMLHAFETYEPATDAAGYKFVKSANKYNKNVDYRADFSFYSDSVRAACNLNVIHPYNAMLPVTIADEIGVETSISKRNYATLADNMFIKIKSTMSSNWASLMAQGGYDLA